MLKYELIPGQLLQEGTITMQNLVAPKRCLEETVLLTHTASYLQQLLCQTLTERQQRVIGFTQSQELTERELIIMQGTIDCALAALGAGIALNIAGGTHHAFADHGEGFCLLNDMAIAANYLLKHGLVKQIMIIDLDVHQGNGTAKLFEDEPRVFTFSMHGATNYPFKKERSDLDIGLENGTTDQIYLDLLYEALPKLLANVKPDFVFYLAGVDILDTDKFGKLSVTLEGCKKRDDFVLSQLKTHSIPCAVALGGGYSPDVNRIVEAHCNTFRLAKDIFECI
jgi:acetoin utilization deacetylase AcuC-like enzyme